ncbi:hypothetical protein PSY28_23485, partial [Shigella flexneri]|nr:hypothetical protein [Shigella flexneri]
WQPPRMLLAPVAILFAIAPSTNVPLVDGAMANNIATGANNIVATTQNVVSAGCDIIRHRTIH